MWIAIIVGSLVVLFIALAVIFAVCLEYYQASHGSEAKVNPPQKQSPRSKYWGMVAVALFWSSVTMAFDIYLFKQALRQLRTNSYTAVEGKVMACSVKEVPGDEGTMYRPAIEYAYVVENQAYTGRRIQFGQWSHSSKLPANEFVDEHPVNSPVTVYFDPAEPGNAVLVTGLTGLQLYLVLFMAPFNIVMATLWAWLFAETFLSPRVKLALMHLLIGTRSRARRDVVCIRLPDRSPIVAAWFVAVAASIILAVCTGICTCLMPPVIVMVVVWSFYLIAIAFAYLRQAWRLRSGQYDLVIDRATQTLTLPQTFGRKTSVLLPLAQLVGMETRPVEKKDSEGSTSSVLVLILQWRDTDAGLQEATLAEWYEPWDEQCVETFARWVKSHFGEPPLWAMEHHPVRAPLL